MSLPARTPPTTPTAESQDNYFPNFVLPTQDNQPRRFYDDLLRGKVVLINFMLVTCRDICPLATTNLVQVQNPLGERLGREVFIYSITMDPQMDTPEVLKQYATGYRTKPGWYFLTGKDEEIQILRRKRRYLWSRSAHRCRQNTALRPDRVWQRGDW